MNKQLDNIGFRESQDEQESAIDLVLNIDETVSKIDSIQNMDKDLNIDKNYNRFIIEKIRLFIDKNPIFFTEFIKKYKVLCKNKVTYKEIINEYGNDLSFVIQDFFKVLQENLGNKVEYQKILNNKGNLLFYEALTRIRPKNGTILTFNLGDYLNLHADLDNTFDLYLNILNLVFLDFSKRSLPDEKISINVEISDVLDDRFIKAFYGMQRKYGININKKNNPLVIEILENQHLGEDKESKLKFRNRIIELKDLGFKIAMDDVISELLPTGKTLENLDNLSLGNFSNLVDYVKVDGKFIHNIFKVHKTCPEYINVDKIKDDLEKIQKKGIGIVFEWIENREILDFITKTLKIENPNFQGFYFNEK